MSSCRATNANLDAWWTARYERLLEAARTLRGCLVRDRVFGNAPEEHVQEVLQMTMWVDDV